MIRVGSLASLTLALLAGALLLGASGCLSSRPALEPRFYLVPAPAELAPKVAEGAPKLRLGRVSAAPHLRERIAWRLSDVELAFDEEHRWAVPPEEMTRDAIERACFASGRYRSTSERGTGQLEVHLEEFEGNVRDEVGTVVLRLALSTREGMIFSQRVRREVALPETTADALARTLGAALDAAAQEVVTWVQAPN